MREQTYCISCNTDLSIIDRNPDGRENATCARCRAEEEHDFNKEPKAKFTRGGHRIEPRKRATP